jgi:DinB superfamily
MKKLFILFTAFIITSFTSLSPTLSEKERADAIDLLSKTEQGVFNSLLGLNEAQLNFKPAPDRWSIAECVKHIAVTDITLWKMTDGVIKGAPNPEKRSEIKATDEQVVQGTESREHKIKTAPMLEPQNSPFKSTPDALASFFDDRKKLIEFVKTTNDDLRAHVATMPFGSFDSYQMILLIAAHSNRHTQQIEEVKADPNYPKN